MIRFHFDVRARSRRLRRRRRLALLVSHFESKKVLLHFCYLRFKILICFVFPLCLLHSLNIALSSWKVLKRKKIKLLSQNSYRGSRWDYPKEPNNTGLVHKLVECFNCTTEIFSNRFSRKGQFYTWVNSTLVSNNHFTIIPTAKVACESQHSAYVLLKGRNRKHTLKWTKTVKENFGKTQQMIILQKLLLMHSRRRSTLRGRFSTD